MTSTLPQEIIDLLDLELIDPSQSEYGFKGYYPVLDTHLMWHSGIEGWKLAEKVKVSKKLEGWYFYGAIPINREAAMVQHLIRLKHQIDDSVLYIKEAKVKNKLKKIKEDFK
jgi:hypothetical protein